jgi:PilZ domain
MKFGRSAPEKSTPVTLPGRTQMVTLAPIGGERLPARVLECAPDTLVVAIMVATEPLTYSQLEGLVLEFTDAHGRVRLTGTASIESPSQPDVVRIDGPRSIEVLQEREYVRIKSARPALVYGLPDGAPIRSYTVDLSGGGFLLAGPDSLKIGDQVQFQLTLTPGVLLISGTGKVVRVDTHGRLGVAFDSITELDRRRLIRFIFECQRTERQRGLEMDDGHGG